MIQEIFSKVDEHIADGNLIKEFNMSALPTLYEQFVRLIDFLVIVPYTKFSAKNWVFHRALLKCCLIPQKENKKEDKDHVVILLLDMLEVVTRDIMEDSVPR